MHCIALLHLKHTGLVLPKNLVQEIQEGDAVIHLQEGYAA